ncbi:MAG: hypothetical protein ABR584_10945 [Candidatus Baltobacteraceae bacterium]
MPKQTHTLSKLAIFAMCSLLVTGCGGGGGSSAAPPTVTPGPPIATPPSSTSSVSGIAATGKSIAAAAVSLKDSTGATKSATTAADGSYSIDTTGMTGPFIVTTTSGSTKLYSVSADSNAKTVVNITPLTDVVARSWYGAQSTNIDAAFASSSPNAPAPVAAASITGAVQNIVQLWLTKAGVSATGFNIISTPFAANGTGLDLVLSETSVNQATGQVKITDGSTTQNSTITYASGTMTVATTTTGPAGTSSSVNSTAIPVQSSQQSAIALIQASLSAFANVVNTRGSALVAADLLPFLDPNLLLNGQNASQTATEFASEIAGASVVFTIQQVKQLDATGADVLLNVAITKSGQTQNQGGEFFFKPVGSSWLFSGNGRKASVNIQSEARTNQGTSPSPSGPDVNVDIDAPKGTITGGTISGGTWGAQALTPGPTRIRPSGQYDAFFYNTGTLAPSQVPAAGTIFTANLSTAAGPLSYAVPINAATSELIRVTNPTGTTVAAANLGSPLTVNWTLPTTYAVSAIQVSALSFTGPQSDPASFQCETNAIVGPTATSTTLTIPASCNGQAVTNVDLNVSTTGINGERSLVIDFLQ